MGAKQSKRSVDISGKEAESAGEVAAAGAGGEGRVEQLADADALKPQVNGDAHIHENSEKEKELDGGTPENEKDATTEKEGKASEDEKDKEAVAITNGETEQKTENGDSTPTLEEGKKPKKEKVKKKWSLRSISFSRKDKPKQEKKQKDEEPKTNGDPEKVLEETADATTPEVVVNVPEAIDENGTKEKTAETPVTEPITNGSSTPESPKEVIEDSATTSLDNDQLEPKTELEPENLAFNGISLEEHKTEVPETEKNIIETMENNVEEPAVEKSPEIIPTPEITVKEVCVEQMPLLEPTPPPLPANPPPVASFAATTMAPELADASLPKTDENSLPPISNVNFDEAKVEPSICLTNNEIETQLITATTLNDDANITQIEQPKVLEEIFSSEITGEVELTSEIVTTIKNSNVDFDNESLAISHDTPSIVVPKIELTTTDSVNIIAITEVSCESQIQSTNTTADNNNVQQNTEEDIISDILSGDLIQKEGVEVNSNHIPTKIDKTVDQNIIEPADVKLDNKKDFVDNISDTMECNGNMEEQKEKDSIEESETDVNPKVLDVNIETMKTVEHTLQEPMPFVPETEEALSSGDMDPSHPPPTPQEPLEDSNKMTDLIPEIQAAPELKTETLQDTSTDVAVAN